MHRSLQMLLSASVIALGSSAAYAQDTSAPPEQVALEQAPADPAPAEPEAAADETEGDQTIVVTARKREETLQDVPVAATAISGDLIEKRGLVSVKEVAALTPSLNINSDGAGRAFIAIRGIGTTLIDSVQPGVGIFLDGIYQPNTSYLNNPMVDVERVEVLRGPQGTLYGKNTLGGAINVITRQPGNELEFKATGSYAGPDEAWTAGASISGPIIEDRLQARVAYVHQQQDGFMRNTLVGVDANPLNTDTINATVRAEPVDDIELTVNGYYTWVKGGAVPYAFVDGPTDYSREVRLNATNYQFFKYRGLNAKLEFPIESIATDVTLIGAYDNRDVKTPDADGDFIPTNFLRTSGRDDLKTRTVELRFDSELSSTLSTILGAFYSRETRVIHQDAFILPDVFNFLNTTDSRTEGDTYALFGNVFWRPTEAWELSAGLRWDRQDRVAEGLIVSSFPVPGSTVTGGELKETNLSPRVAVTRHWNSNLMSYASIARGSRGGGFNPPAVDESIRTYKGDSVWTYEIGSKYTSPDRRLSLAASLFYNDYKDYIGLNSIVATPTGFTTVDLNTGDVKSYGIELEGSFKVTPQWTLSGGGSLMKARITDDDIYTETTGRTLQSERLPFQPDWNFNVNSDYVVPVGKGDVTFNTNLIGKGSRIPASIRDDDGEFPGHPLTPTLKSYVLVNGSLTYRLGGFEVGAFVNNLFNKDYFESYIERTTLILAGIGNSDIGIVGDRRRYGVRARVRF